MTRTKRTALLSLALALLANTAGQAKQPQKPAEILAALITEASQVKVERQSAKEFKAAAAAYRDVLKRLRALDRSELGPDDEIDAELLEAHAGTRLYEIEEVRLHELVPVRYLSLFNTSGLFLRPCGATGRQIDQAIEELERFPEVVASAKANLKRPARSWTENAIYTAGYASSLLTDDVPELCTDDTERFAKLKTAAAPAVEALDDYIDWMERELLPRSDRSPTWTVEQIDVYQIRHEGLVDYDSREMLRIALEEERILLDRMAALAERIHPSGDLEIVWGLMKDEAPPWDEVPAMAQRYVEMADDWLRGPGSHLVEIPEEFDYGVQITSPMGRRILSFGGASYGPTVAGRISGYYVLTPLEDRLTEEEKASRIRSYNPYWTHVISYHEWLGHNVQRAIASEHVERPMRKLFRSSYLSQAWSFYLEKLLEDEGYFDVLPHMEALKTRMARLQMRMWRVQRIITKIRMALGEMTFDDAVQAYIDKIGMEPTNALIEVQRDSQSPSPPGREIIGERVILEMREAYARRLGEHFRLRNFHTALLRYGDLPLPTVERLMLGD